LKKLLVVYHSKNGSTGAMAEAVCRGACNPDIDVDVRLVPAREAGVDDLLWCDAVIFGTPENFGYMSGALKDFFDRTYYPLEGRIEGLPYAVFICAGNDGRGALNSIQRIVSGYPMKEVHEPLVCRGGLTDEILANCEELGMYVAAGIEAGVF